MFLLKKPIEVLRKPNKVVLAELSGEARPVIGETVTYMWRVHLVGSKEYTDIECLTVIFDFQKNNQMFGIRDIAPRREREEKAKVTLNVIPQIQVSIPIIDEKVIGRITPTGAEWKFFDINLPDNLTETFMGALAIEFFEGADGEKFSIGMQIEPHFHGRYLLGLRSKDPPQGQPVIDFSTMRLFSKPIIPYVRGKGRPSLDAPEKERIQEYEWEIDEGILKKMPGIRNVSLRAETLSLMFKEIEKSMPKKRFRKVMKNAGYTVGKSFVEDIEKSTGRKLTLSEWSDYDSAAGMGRYIFETVEGNVQTLIVKNSFIAYQKRSERPECDFFFQDISKRY